MKEIKVWSLYVRLSHWLIVILFSGLIITGKAEEDYVQWHFYMGYGLSALLLCRILYGLVGKKGERFIDFFPKPSKVFAYLRQGVKGQPQHYLGHNPLGAIMVVVLLLLLVSQIGSGLVSSDDVFWYGPMYEWVSEEVQMQLADWHHQVPDWLLLLVACHILGVLFHEIRFKERLIKAMFHGKKKLLGKSAEDADLFTAIPVKKALNWPLLIPLLLSLAWLYWLWHLPI